MWTVLAQLSCLKVERGKLARRMSSPRGGKSLSVGEFNMVVNVQLENVDRTGTVGLHQGRTWCVGETHVVSSRCDFPVRGEFNMVVNAQLSSCSDKSGGEYAAGEQETILLSLDVNGGKILRLCIV